MQPAPLLNITGAQAVTGLDEIGPVTALMNQYLLLVAGRKDAGQTDDVTHFAFALALKIG